MPWTTEQQLQHLMRLPWTIDVETNATDPDDVYLVARVREVPSAIATGKDQRELASDLWESLRASLEVYLEAGNQIPRPAGRVLPWERGDAPPVPMPHIVTRLAGAAWESVTSVQGVATQIFALGTK